jgi:hypothetical protein
MAVAVATNVEEAEAVVHSSFAPFCATPQYVLYFAVVVVKRAAGNLNSIQHFPGIAC